ncbi:hypothetical protein NLJ89_g4869 [Agrocybe chaxingu]|uniref:RNase III domain-containing protein n=1 Tax=Agrocybe chaxingu TaxID=84603 RepID=A0A9W8MU60_9AGAR|nr:hypothetical protein NLJ89_g4869 [Agrocybe chaxingu]
MSSARIPGFRRYSQATAVLEQHQGAYRAESVPPTQQEEHLSQPASGEARSQRRPEKWSSRTYGFSWRGPSPEELAVRAQQQKEYLERLFHPLKFPPELVQRILTHSSHVQGRNGHNGAFSFLGRRVMSAYFQLFLHKSPSLKPSDDLEDLVSRALHTNLVGQHIGDTWGVGRELVWEPNAPSSRLDKNAAAALRAAGLYKVQGEAVQAMIGAIYHQYGGAVALRVFHTRVLPLLLVKGGLPKVFHKDVKSQCDKFGGPEGPLLVPREEKAPVLEDTKPITPELELEIADPPTPF